MVSFSEGLVFVLKTYSLEHPAVLRIPINETEQHILTSITNKFQEAEYDKGHPANWDVDAKSDLILDVNRIQEIDLPSFKPYFYPVM